MPFEYIKSPSEIYRQSFDIIEAEAKLDHLSAAEKTIAVRLAHACGMVEVCSMVQFHKDFIDASRNALAVSASIYVDSEMVRHGIIKSRLAKANPVICTLNDARTNELAQDLATTRSAAAVELWHDLAHSIVVIGNAPTALFHLLERIERGQTPPPAAIIGLPVGFVGAAESKHALMQTAIPWVSIEGRLGGSAMAASVINSLAGLTL